MKNYDDVNFIQKIFSLLPDLNSHDLIMGGHFNCYLNPSLDCSSIKPTQPSKTATALQLLLNTCGQADVWRFYNPTAQQYPFFSHVQHNYSRIDYFLDKKLLPRVKSCSNSSPVISDHTPLTLSLLFQDRMFSSGCWRFNFLILSDKKFCDSLKEQLDIFLEINTIPETFPSLIWEALKAYAQGQIISYSAGVNKQRRKKLEELSLEILQIYSTYATFSDPGIYKKRLKLQTYFNMLSTYQAQFKI